MEYRPERLQVDSQSPQEKKRSQRDTINLVDDVKYLLAHFTLLVIIEWNIVIELLINILIF